MLSGYYLVTTTRLYLALSMGGVDLLVGQL
jgi:hypothetical protein